MEEHCATDLLNLRNEEANKLKTIFKSKKMKQQWRKLNGEKISNSIQEEVRSMIIREKEVGHELKVCIGTESQVKNTITEFATVIVFIRNKKGGLMYIHNEVTKHRMSIRQRMLTEVAMSIDVAYSLCNIFTFHKVDMEIHADINTNPGFKINDALKEAMGNIPGMGFAFNASSEVFAGASCANTMVQ